MGCMFDILVLREKEQSLEVSLSEFERFFFKNKEI